MKRITGALAVFFGAASFGILSTFVKKAYAQGFTLGEVTGIQALLGMLFLWFLYALLRMVRKEKTRYSRQTKWWKIILAGFSTGIVSILYYKCVESVPASIAIVLLMQYIWMSALINALVYKQKPSQREGLGILFILAATLLATGIFEQAIGHLDYAGLSYGLLAALAYAISIIVTNKIGTDYPPLQKSAYMVTGAFLLIMLLLQPFHLLSITIAPVLVQYGFLLAFFGTVLPPLLFAYGMPKIGISLSSILSAVELPVAVGMSYYILNEPVSVLQWFGTALIIGLIVWINAKKKLNYANQ